MLVTVGGGAAVWKMLAPKPAASAPDKRAAKDIKGGPAGRPAVTPPPEPEFVTDRFREVHGVTADALQTWATGLPVGYVPLRATARAGSAPPVFDAMAVPDPGVAEPLLELTPYADTQTVFDNRWNKYWALSRALTPDGQTEIWVWGVRTAAGFTDYRSYSSWGTGLADVFAKVTAADRKTTIPFAFQTADTADWGPQAVLVLDRNEHAVGWELAPTVAPDAVPAGAAAARTRGWWPRLLTVSAGTPHTFAVLYAENRPAVEWELQHELPAAEYGRELRVRAAGGWVPRAVNSAETAGGPRYTVVWTKPVK